MTDKMIDWTKKHRVLSIVIGFISPLIIVHILFFIPAPFSFLASQWEAGDIIAYCAGFMAFVGTIFLGIIAIDQNNKLRDQNDKLMEIQSQEKLRAQSCNINLKARPKNTSPEDILYTLDSESEADSDIKTNSCCILIHNTSPAFLQSVKIYAGTFKHTICLTLSEGEKQVVNFPVLNGVATYQVEFTSCYGVKTYGDFKVSLGCSNTDLDLLDNNRTPHIKYYHFHGTTPPKQEDTTDANT